MRCAGVSGVAEKAEVAAEVCVCGRMVKEGPEVGFIHQAEDFLDAIAPPFKIVFHDFFLHRQDLFLFFPFPIAFSPEGYDVHELALVDWEGEDVAVVSDVHLGVARQLVS